jgi:peptidoglycan/LPS O-acetylase OafA/YrhL
MPYTVLWSLAVEEHFYLAWPAAVKRISSRGLMALAISLMVLSPVMRFCCVLLPAKYAGIVGGCMYYTWDCADGLALGAAMALVIRQMNDDRRKLLRFSFLLIAIGFLIAGAGYPFGIITRMNPIGAALQWVPWHFGLAGLLGIFVVIGSGKWKGIVAPRILTFVGAISYGLYLYHLLFLFAYQWVARRTGFEQRWNLDLWQRTWLPFTVAGTAAIVFSYLSRWYFEEPFLRLKDRWERPRDSSDASKIGAASEAVGAIKT